MSIFKCIVCDGDLNILGELDNFNKKMKCCNCGFENGDKKETIVIKRRLVKPSGS